MEQEVRNPWSLWLQQALVYDWRDGNTDSNLVHVLISFYVSYTITRFGFAWPCWMQPSQNWSIWLESEPFCQSQEVFVGSLPLRPSCSPPPASRCAPFQLSSSADTGWLRIRRVALKWASSCCLSELQHVGTGFAWLWTCWPPWKCKLILNWLFVSRTYTG